MVVVIERWHVPYFIVIPIGSLFLIVDLAFFTGNLAKFTSGGWIPLLMGSFVLVTMVCWKLGRVDLHRKSKKRLRKMTHKRVVGTYSFFIFISFFLSRPFSK